MGFRMETMFMHREYWKSSMKKNGKLIGHTPEVTVLSLPY